MRWVGQNLIKTYIMMPHYDDDQGHRPYHNHKGNIRYEQLYPARQDDLSAAEPHTGEHYFRRGRTKPLNQRTSKTASPKTLHTFLTIPSF